MLPGFPKTEKYKPHPSPQPSLPRKRDCTMVTPFTHSPNRAFVPSRNLTPTKFAAATKNTGKVGN